MNADDEALLEVDPRERATADHDRQRANLEKAWATPRGWRYVSAVNNTEVGKWYLVGALVFLFFGGALALLMRAQLAVPNNDLVGQPLYDQLFTMHGSVMMFLFAVPIFEAFAILLLPTVLGARDLPFPRLSAFGFWSFAIGGVFFCASLFFGVAPSGGWFMYPPLTSSYQSDLGADFWLLGLSFIEIASISAAVELIVGVLRCRPPGMRIHLTPLYAWYVLVVGAMILFAFPPLIAGDILLELERAFDWPFFDVRRGGDPLLWQHLFWIFGHPEVYIVFLPSVALVAMIVPTFAGRPLVGYGWVVLSAVGVGFISFGLWVHHMFTTGMPGISLALFSAASEVVAIPTGIQLFCFVATMLAGRIKSLATPMLFVLGTFAIFVLGGLTGVMVALVPFDLQAHDSYFVVAHLHSVLIGGTLFPIIGGVYYFYPLFFGKQLSERLGRIAFWLMFIGFNVTFLPMHVTGMRGMPRRVYTYAADLGLAELNLTSTIGAFVLALGFLVFAVDLLRPKQRQPDAPPNPWNAGTLEWVEREPDMPWGVRSIPDVNTRYPLWEEPEIVDEVASGRGYLPDAEEGLRETLVTSTVDAVPMQCLRVAGPTFLTLWAAAFLGGSFIFATFHWWWAALVSGIAATGFILRWLWTGTAIIPEKPTKEVRPGLALPLYVSGRTSIGWWGLLVTLLADATAFISLVFGYFFYFTVHDDFPPAGPHPDTPWALAGLALLVVAGACTEVSRRWNRRGRVVPFYVTLTTGLLAAISGSAALLLALLLPGMDPTLHVYPAIVWVLVAWSVFHVGLGVLMQGYCLARRFYGRMTDIHDADIANVSLYWYFTTATVVLTVAVIVGFPEAV